MSYYSSDEDVDIHVSRRRAPSPAHYVETRPRPRIYNNGPSYLVPERTVVTTRSRSRERRSSSPGSAAPAPAPVIINNRIYNEHSSDEEDGHHQGALTHHRSHSRAQSSYMTREDYEIERTRRELEELKVSQAREKEDRRTAKEMREEAELLRAKRELEDIKKREARTEDEKRIRRQLELEQLKEEERKAEEKKRREKEAEHAVERYKQKEFERIAKEKEEKEARDKEYKRRLHEDLLASGFDEKQITAIMKKEKLAEGNPGNRPTYTRMARRHLSIETLRTFRIEFDLDPDPEYILIKRWVPEWEQDTLWKHTKYIREKRSKVVLSIEDGHKKHHHHHHHEPELEFVRKKERRRSKSPALLMYLAGAKPS